MQKSVFDRLQDLQLTDCQRKTLAADMREQRLAKGEVVFSQGDETHYLYALVSGLVKLVYYTPDGKELIKSFIQEGDLFGSLVSQMGLGGSTFSAVCLEDCTVQLLPYKTLEKCVDGNLALKDFTIQLFRNLALKKEIREYEFLCLSAEARYKRFLKKHPEIVQRIAQQDLARYLGITPIALSRLKHRL